MVAKPPQMNKPGPLYAKPLSVLLSDVFSDAYAKQGFAARELVTRWAEIAGADIARYAEPLKIQWPRPVEGQPQEPAPRGRRVGGRAGASRKNRRRWCCGSRGRRRWRSSTNPTCCWSGSTASLAGMRWAGWRC